MLMLRTRLLAVLPALITVLATTAAQAQLTWGINGSGGTGSWDGSTPDWYNGSSNTTWVPGDAATFGGTGGLVTINPGGGEASQLTFDSTGYTLAGDTVTDNSSSPGLTVETDDDATIDSNLSLDGALTKTGSGTLTLGGAFTSNAAVNINAGTLDVVSPQAVSDDIAYNLANTVGANLVLSDVGQTFTIGSLSGGGASGGNVTVGSTSGTTTLAFEGRKLRRFSSG
jgi:fibronectin-binding autotransporter adhesin